MLQFVVGSAPIWHKYPGLQPHAEKTSVDNNTALIDYCNFDGLAQYCNNTISLLLLHWCDDSLQLNY